MHLCFILGGHHMKSNSPCRKQSFSRKKIILPFFHLNRAFKRLFFPFFVLQRLFSNLLLTTLKKSFLTHTLVANNKIFMFFSTSTHSKKIILLFVTQIEISNVCFSVFCDSKPCFSRSDSVQLDQISFAYVFVITRQIFYLL